VFYSDDPTSLYTYLAVGTWTTQTINVTVTRQWSNRFQLQLWQQWCLTCSADYRFGSIV